MIRNLYTGRIFKDLINFEFEIGFTKLDNEKVIFYLLDLVVWITRGL